MFLVTNLIAKLVLTNSMQYYQNIIYAHRPWMSKSYLQPQPPKGPGYLHAREMCIQSAIAIAKILVLYETSYTLRRINVQAVSITSSAVLFLLFAAVSKHPSQQHNDITVYLSTCFRALDEFALSWQSARRAKDLLVGLQRQWEIRTRSTQFSRRSNGTMHSPQKRPPMLNHLDATISVDQGFPLARHELYDDFDMNENMEWMLMADAQFLPDTCA